MAAFAQYTQVRKGDGSSYVTGVDLGTKNSAYTDTSSAVTYLDSTMSSKITRIVGMCGPARTRAAKAWT